MAEIIKADTKTEGKDTSRHRIKFLFKKETWMIITILMICVNFALKRVYYADFFPINGDFQNYNGYRRLLSGQIPFKDFYYYLGFGPLYMGSLILLFIGDHFNSSLLATNFLTSIMFVSAIYCIFRVNRLNRSKSLFLSSIILLAAVGFADPLHLLSYFSNVDFLEYAHPGNSMRMVRAFLPFFLVLVLLWENKRNLKVAKLSSRPYVGSLIYGIFIGICIAWSNDYGISTFLASTYIFALVRIRERKNFLVNLFLYGLGGLMGCFIIVNLLTLGNFFNWFDYNFWGVAKYQTWYYGIDTTNKVLQIQDIPVNAKILCSIVIMIYLSWKIIVKKNKPKDIYLLFLLTTTFIAGYGYAIGSDKRGLFIPLYMVFYITIISRGIKWAEKYIDTKYIQGTSIILYGILFFMVMGGVKTTFSDLTEDRGTYVPRLHGYLSKYGDELIHMSHQFVKEEEVFSTYASAVEVMNDQYQPTGLDYIIHVLGDQYRDVYVDTFKQREPKFVTTIREDFTGWELWSKRANWFFYREFLGKYRVVAATPYNILWEKQEENFEIKEDAQYSLEKVSENSQGIHVKTKENLHNVIVDLKISYTTGWNEKRLRGLGLRKMVSVEDGWSEELISSLGMIIHYNLPEQAEDIHIPVKIIKGEGQVVLHSFPKDLTEIKITHCRIEKILPDVPKDLSEIKATK